VPSNGFTKDELLHLAHQAEIHSNHPIAQSIIGACACGSTPNNVCNFEAIAGSGVKAYTDDSTIVACNDALLHEKDIPHDVCEVGGTGVHLVVNDKYAGHIVISDELKDDAEQAVNRLKQVGVRRVMMLTGDCEEVASRVAAKLNLDDYRAGMLPEDKVNAIAEIEKSRAPGEKIAAVGDGINDAPLLARADVGVAMGGLGSDAALESADVVIMNDQPSKLAEAILIGRKTRAVVWQNIGLAMGIKAVFIVLGIAGVASLWEAVFADVGVALLAIANATRVLR
jgi:Cd2+/Zn2+-exporting ATPase